MLKIIQTVSLLFFFHISSAQILIKGRVMDINRMPVELTLVNLKQGNANLGTAITDSTGSYQLKVVPRGKYTILFKNLAYKDSTLTVNLNRDTILNLQFRHVQNLKEVSVHAKKPIFQREIDRLIFNVAETDLVFGNTVWDVIEKTPLVNVSADGTLQISGTSGATVYLNNKRKLLTGNALKSYLSSIPSDNLEIIEVITTPSSKYDAEGGAGILNIVTKKNKEEGLIGNVALSTRQTAVNSEAGSIYLNNRSGKWNLFSTAYMGNRSRQPLYKKDIYYPAGDDNYLRHRSINSSNDFQVLYPGVNLGIDRQINTKNVVGLLFDYSGDWHKETRNAFSRDEYRDGDSLQFTHNKDDLNSQTYSLNLNYMGKLDSAGKTLSVDFDLLAYRSANHSVSKTDALALETQQALFVKDWFRSSSPQHINNQSVKFDFVWPVNKKVSFDFGAKVSLSKVDNDLLFEDRIADDTWSRDPGRSNLFKYDENINSVYGVLHRKLNTKWAYQLGLRLENTVAKGWLEGVKVVDRNYINVFPTAFLKYTTAKQQTFVLAVSSRITRPSFWDVNPFRTYTTDQTYYEGNPFLTPSKYYREELSHTFESKTGTFSIQFAASQLFDEFYALPYNPSANIIANKKVNYGNKYGFSNTITYYKELFAWWKLSSTILTGYVLSKGDYADQVTIDNRTMVCTVNTNQTFSISRKKGLSCTVIANNTFPSTIVNTRIGNRLETEIRIRKSAGPWNITLSGQDFFKSNKDRFKVLLNELRITDENYYDTRSVALSLSFNFGKSTVKDKRDRATGADDIKQRTM